MHEIFEFLFAQYKNYTFYDVVLEVMATFVFGLLSVVFSARNNILVYPTGIISSLIFIYVFYSSKLYGDIIISAYYVYMSIYGWLLWARGDGNSYLMITTMSGKDNWHCLLIFIISVIFVSLVYFFTGYFTAWWAYVDTFTTGLFFAGMWLLAKRKVENWIFLIAGDIIVTGIYFYKGLIFTGLFYIILTIIAIFGYLAWKKTLAEEPAR